MKSTSQTFTCHSQQFSRPQLGLRVSQEFPNAEILRAHKRSSFGVWVASIRLGLSRAAAFSVRCNGVFSNEHSAPTRTQSISDDQNVVREQLSKAHKENPLHVGPFLNDLKKLGITDRVIIQRELQAAIDSDSVCITDEPDEGLAIFLCVEPGENEDLSLRYFSAAEALAEYDRKWKLRHSSPSSEESELLEILKSVAVSSSVRALDLVPALEHYGWSGERANHVIELLVDRDLVEFFKTRHGEAYIELTNEANVKVHILRDIEGRESFADLMCEVSPGFGESAAGVEAGHVRTLAPTHHGEE